MPVYAAKPPLPSIDKRWRIVNGTMRRHGYVRHALIEALHSVQQSFGYLDDTSLKFVAASLRVPLSQAFGVATFYHFFSLKPPGEHTCLICIGTACYIKGGGQFVAKVEKTLGNCRPYHLSVKYDHRRQAARTQATSGQQRSLAVRCCPARLHA
jgi:bidirectional [NiFe] hydrogenase diaphorase subunit